MRLTLILAIAIAAALPICAQAQNSGGNSKPPATNTVAKKPATNTAADKTTKPFIKFDGIKGEAMDKDHPSQ
jgi:hypothetical protein